MKVTFLGAAGTVTGSSYLVELSSKKFIVDCGMFQGLDVESRNSEEFIFDPSVIDFVILTHAHMDHAGLLPKLVKHGFRGEIYMTPPTAALTEILLLDSAKIQENQAKGERKYSEAMPRKAKVGLYDTADSLNTISMFHSVPFEEKVNKGEIEFMLFNVGHILGAATVAIKAEGKLIVFSGDIGRRDQSVIKPPNYMISENSFISQKIDYVFMESLYGGQHHPDRTASKDQLMSIINETLGRNGNVIIPTFAVHRTQEMLQILKYAYNNRLISDNVQTFLDSPLAIKATRIYTANNSYFSRSTGGVLSNKNDSLKLKEEATSPHIAMDDDITTSFNFDNLQYINHHKQSLRLKKKGSKIVLAGSGMADGGRVLNHLVSDLGSRSSSIIFVGFQAEGTLGRTLTEGHKKVVINKKQITVNAQVELLRGFSAHGDENDLLMWLKQFELSSDHKIFLMHSEPDRAEAFSRALFKGAYNSIIPKWKEIVEL